MQIELSWQQHILPKLDQIVNSQLTDAELERIKRYQTLGASIYQACAQQPFVDLDNIFSVIGQSGIENPQELKKQMSIWYPFAPFLLSVIELRHKHQRANSIFRMWENFEQPTDYRQIPRLQGICEVYARKLNRPEDYLNVLRNEAKTLQAASVFLPNEFGSYPIIVPDLISMGVRRFENTYRQIVGLGQNQLFDE